MEDSIEHEGAIFERLGKCPCGRPVYANVDEGTAGLIHLTPTCVAFDRMEPSDFVAWMRRSFGILDTPPGVN